MFCPNCGANVSSSEYVCPKCNNVLRQPEVVNSVNDQDTPTIGLKLVSFLVPIVGIILYFLWSKEFPVKAKSCLKLSLILILCITP